MADILPPPPVACPTCGASAEGEAFHALGTLRFIDFLCGNGHIWQTKWMHGGAA